MQNVKDVVNPLKLNNMKILKVKVYFENNDSTMGGCEVVSIFKLSWWLFLGRIHPKEKTTIYYITKIETICGVRI